MHISSTNNRSVSLRGRLAGLIRGEHAGEFATLTADGAVHCYRIE